MSTYNKIIDLELERFLDRQIISDFFEGEEEFDKKLREKYYTPYTFQINILNKEWVKKWKGIVGYEQIKEKCRRCNNSRQNEKLKDELYEFLIKNDVKKKFEELGKMNFPNITKGSYIGNLNNIVFNDKIDFIPMSDLYCSYLNKYIENKITVSGSFVKGKCFLYNEIINKKKDEIKEKKVLILEKRIGNNNEEFNALMITLGVKEDIKKFINNVKNKTFEELMKDKNLKVEKREISQNQVNENIKGKKELEETKRKEEEEKKKKELEEKMWKEFENKERKKKEKMRKEEEVKKIKELEEKMRKEEEERRRKEEEEKKKKEEEEKKKKEEK